jgi:hypothetical protein
VKHNFPIQKDGTAFAEVRVIGYSLENVMAQNKRIDLVYLNGSENIDDEDLTVIEPIKLFS